MTELILLTSNYNHLKECVKLFLLHLFLGLIFSPATVPAHVPYEFYKEFMTSDEESFLCSKALKQNKPLHR